MAISKELEKISTCCNQIADNVIELRRANMQLQSDEEFLKKTVLECQINLHCKKCRGLLKVFCRNQRLFKGKTFEVF